MRLIPFIDLAAQRARLGGAVDEAILRVVNHGAYILGPEVAQLEAELSAFCGTKHVISCANGTDALAMVLMAKGVRPGDAVFCPSFTFAATAEVVAWFGATPVFVDVREDTFNMDPASLALAIDTARKLGLRPTAAIPVDLFGQPADYDSIEPICAREGLWMLSDAAQSFGATYCSRKVGTIGEATSTSFFPAKPLGCYGDGGAIFTESDALADVLRSIRVHGQGVDKYDNERIGLNGQLDTIQTAVLIEKLKIFADEIETRDRIARRYNDRLRDGAIVPEIEWQHVGVGAVHVAHTGIRPAGLPGGAEARGYPDRDLLSEAAAQAGRLQALSGRRKRAAGIGPARGGGDQPTHAPLSLGEAAGPRRARREVGARTGQAHPDRILREHPVFFGTRARPFTRAFPASSDDIASTTGADGGSCRTSP
jgi:dTDP-4-amino-4,6-dideoxygalactose transaminase